MFFLIIVFLSQFIWNIEVIGNKTIDRKDIIKSCEEIGIKEGVPAAAIDTKMITIVDVCKTSFLVGQVTFLTSCFTCLKNCIGLTFAMDPIHYK